MIQEIIILIVQIVAAFGVVVSVFYLGVQVKQQNAITKAQFGFSLTQRLYDRFFRIATDEKFCELLAKDWKNDELRDAERFQCGFYIHTLLVDIFDTYDKVHEKLLNPSQLEMRMNLLRRGMMKTTTGKMIWNLWKPTQSENFVEWFESQIFADEELAGFNLDESELVKKTIR